MAEKAQIGSKLTGEKPGSTRPVTWLLLGGAVVIGAVLRAARLTESPGGFHVFNEYFYLQHAAGEQSRALFAWFYDPVDLNNPPLYVGLVSTVVRCGGPLLASARLVSVLSGVAAIVLVFLLGRLLFDERTGLVAAAAMAVMPGVVLVNHNIQVDSLFVALLLGGVHFYVRCARGGKMSDAVIGGSLLGLATLTKQPAILALLALGAWRAWAQKGFAWLHERRTWAFVAATLCVGGSWYALQLLVAPKKLMGALFYVANTPGMYTIDAKFWSFVLGTQLVWMVFPLAAAVALAGVVVMARGRQTGDLLVLVFLAVYLAYYVAFHKHCYYLLPLAPFVALAIGRACVAAFDRTRSPQALRIAATSLLIASMALGSVMMMSGQKWGRWSPMALRPTMDPGFERVHLYFDGELEGFFSSLQTAIDPKYSPTRVKLSSFVMPPQAPGTQGLYLSPRLSTKSGLPLPAHEGLLETWVRPVFFGYAVGQHWDDPGRTQAFDNDRWTAEKVGPVWLFGTRTTLVPTGYAIYSEAELAD